MDSVRLTGDCCAGKSRVLRMGGESSVSATGILAGLLMLLAGALVGSGIVMGVGFFTMAAAVIYLHVAMDEKLLNRSSRLESGR